MSAAPICMVQPARRRAGAVPCRHRRVRPPAARGCAAGEELCQPTWSSSRRATRARKRLVKKLFGDAVASPGRTRSGALAMDEELRNMFTRTAQPGLWFIAGSFAQCRIYSKIPRRCRASATSRRSRDRRSTAHSSHWADPHRGHPPRHMSHAGALRKSGAQGRNGTRSRRAARLGKAMLICSRWPALRSAKASLHTASAAASSNPLKNSTGSRAEGRNFEQKAARHPNPGVNSKQVDHRVSEVHDLRCYHASQNWKAVIFRAQLVGSRVPTPLRQPPASEHQRTVINRLPVPIN